MRTDVPLREEVDLDSMDCLNFMLELHAALGVDIPDAAYKDVATIDGCIAYLAAHNPQAPSGKTPSR